MTLREHTGRTVEPKKWSKKEKTKKGQKCLVKA